MQAAGFIGAELPLGLTLDPNGTIDSLVPMILDLFSALLPIIIIFMIFGMMMQSMGRMTHHK
jgi:hypothetical protein